ncbi:pyrroloquinoline quinone biosynthesis peptide chaperone PqqD [Citreicella sp. C3M06]|uniref:pyrroloquinoline quinone biosynthesis peptide chaperone PqqD n=1 Tax=Citreicella sp. C3M06 TaxID=2841564 RepID=UPI001C083BA5|nr:pyrroloquinoline quinone biosynthesis peptide chaperone PqqD [Citreicella sp. C3M06]MBU2961092.1 pyrroloquinoline quinone biosynthesis peptide chaperone PqqD [Citreicella sp. C3M06]
MMQPEEIPFLPRGVRIHRDAVRDTWVLLAPERTVTLDEIAHAILSEVDGVKSLQDITASLAARYQAPAEQIAKDAAGFLGALHDRRFVDLS